MKKNAQPAAWALQVIVALTLAPMAITKFVPGSPSAELFTEIGMEPAGRHIIGVIEMVAVAMLLIPTSAAWGAILAWGVMTGALIAHLTVLGPGEPVPVLGVPFVVLAATNWIGAAAIIVLRRRDIEFIRNMSPDQDASPGKP